MEKIITVAGRIVKESYGALRQQHIFRVSQINIVGNHNSVYYNLGICPSSNLVHVTFFLIFKVKVLWTKHSMNRPSLSTLFVRGCNLYRYGTFRQVNH